MNSSAVVTGAASGIGRVLVKQLAQQGFNLTVVDLDAQALMTLREELQQQLPTVGILVVAGDVCSNAAMGRAFKEHQSRYGGVDLVVLNAGIGERGDFLETSNGTEALEKTLDVDLRAVITGARLAAQAMIAGQQGGRIISIASAAGIFPMTAGPYYAAAKAGVIHFTRSLAPRLAPYSISLSTVCPQYVDTPLVQKMLREQPEVAKAMMGPLYGHQLLQPQQVVDVIQGLIDAPLPAKGKKVPFKEAYAGAGYCWLLLQNGKVLDPFASNQHHKALAGARVASIASSGGAAGSSRSSSSRRLESAAQPVNQLAAASAASMNRFSNLQALQEFAQQPLPQAYRKLQVVRLSNKFREAVEVVTVKLPRSLATGLPPGHVLVRRLFVGINASDVNYTSGRYHGSSAAAAAALPYDAGFESVGVVVGAHRDAAAAFPIGTAVATMEAGFSEYGVVAARRVLPVPCPAPEVVALLTSGLTASLALEEVGRLCLPGSNGQSDSQLNNQQSAKTTVLVTAAAGGTGQFAVQLAKLAGCTVVATCGGHHKAGLLKQLGADRVIDYRSEDVKAVLKQEYPQGIDIIYESVGGDMFQLCVDALAPKGTLIVIGMMSAYGSGWQPSSHQGLTEKLLWKSATVAGFFLLRYAPLWGSHLQRLCALVQSRQLAVALDSQRFVGLSSVAAAVDRLQSGSSSGKVVVQLSEQLPVLLPQPSAKL